MKKTKLMLIKGSVQRYLWLWQAENGRKMTVGELAKRSELAPGTVDKYLNDRVYRPNMNSVNKLANALGIDPSELVEEVEIEGNSTAPQSALRRMRGRISVGEAFPG